VFCNIVYLILSSSRWLADTEHILLYYDDNFMIYVLVFTAFFFFVIEIRNMYNVNIPMGIIGNNNNIIILAKQWTATIRLPAAVRSSQLYTEISFMYMLQVGLNFFFLISFFYYSVLIISIENTYKIIC